MISNVELINFNLQIQNFENSEAKICLLIDKIHKTKQKLHKDTVGLAPCCYRDPRLVILQACSAFCLFLNEEND